MTEWTDLTYQEAVDYLERILDPATEDDFRIYFLNLLDSTFPGAEVSDLIYWPDYWFNDEDMLHVELSNETIVQYLMAWTGKRLIGAGKVELPKRKRRLRRPLGLESPRCLSHSHLKRLQTRPTPPPPNSSSSLSSRSNTARKQSTPVAAWSQHRQAKKPQLKPRQKRQR